MKSMCMLCGRSNHGITWAPGSSLSEGGGETRDVWRENGSLGGGSPFYLQLPPLPHSHFSAHEWGEGCVCVSRLHLHVWNHPAHSWSKHARIHWRMGDPVHIVMTDSLYLQAFRFVQRSAKVNCNQSTSNTIHKPGDVFQAYSKRLVSINVKTMKITKMFYVLLLFSARITKLQMYYILKVRQQVNWINMIAEFLPLTSHSKPQLRWHQGKTLAERFYSYSNNWEQKLSFG